MNIKSYDDFLLESILLTSPEFKSLLDELKSSDDIVALKFYNLIGDDIKTNYNLLNTTDKNDRISFISDNQASNKIKSGLSVYDLFKSKSNSTTIGRVIKSIFKDNNISVTDRQVEVFVNKFKAEYDKMYKGLSSIKAVTGEDIRYWYLESNYCNDTVKKGKGSLGKSCMRYDNTQQFLNIYVENPEVCSLVIQTDNDKLIARALLWKCNDCHFLDRVYYTNEYDVEIFINWATKKFKDLKTFNNRTGPMDRHDIQLKKGIEYEEYPYMDTFAYYYLEDGVLSNYEQNVSNKNKLYYIQDVDGGYQPQNLVYCDYEGTSHPSDEVVFSKRLDSYLHKDNARWSEYLKDYIGVDNSVYSWIIEDYLDSDSACIVYTGDGSDNYEWYPAFDNDDTNYTSKYNFDELTGYNYLNDALIKKDGKYYLKSVATSIHSVKKEDRDKYLSIFNSISYVCSELDAKVFNIGIYDKYEIVLDTKYYKKVYQKIIYSDLYDFIENLDIPKDLMDKKLDEMVVINRSLANDNFYKTNNYINKHFGDVNGLMRYYRETVDKGFERAFKIAAVEIKNIYMDRDGMKYFKNLCKEYCLYPIDVVNFKGGDISGFEKIKQDVKEATDGLNISYGIDELTKKFTSLTMETINSICSNSDSISSSRAILYYLKYNKDFK